MYLLLRAFLLSLPGHTEHSEHANMDLLESKRLRRSAAPVDFDIHSEM